MGKRMKSKKDVACKRRCVLCGRNLFSFENDYVTGATGRIVCKSCLQASERLFPRDIPGQSSVKASAPSGGDILTPQEIIRQLDKAIIGQERAKRAVAVALWKQLLRAAGDTLVPRTNLLLYGPTGCGKTALVRKAAAIAGLPLISFDATTLSESGYKGRDADEMVKDLIGQFCDQPKLSAGIVFLDEFDKLAARGGDTRTEYNRGTQHSMLKLVEVVTVSWNTTTLSTDFLLFIFGGAFTGLTAKEDAPGTVRQIGFAETQPPANTADTQSGGQQEITTEAFVAFGMEPELLGRVGQYIQLEPLPHPEMKQVLLESGLSRYLQYQRFFAAHGITLEFSSRRIDAIADAAMKRGTGARGLNNLVEAAVEPLLFKLAAGTLHKTVREEDLAHVG